MKVAMQIFFTPLFLGAIALAIHEMRAEQTPKNDAVGNALLFVVIWLSAGVLGAIWFFAPDY